MRTRVLLIAIVAVLGLGVAVMVWWMGGDEPDAVDAGRAIDQERTPDTDAEGEDADEPDTPPTASDDLTGTWVVDTSRPFDRAQGLGTFVGYRVEEELANIGANIAIGRSPDVDGRVVFDGTRIVEAEVTADLTRLESDDNRRDNRVASMLGEGASARFVLDDTIDPAEVPRVGEVIELTASGRLAIGEVERDIDVDLQAVIGEGGGLVVTGSTVILLDDFDVEVPSAGIVLSSSDEATLEWQLFLRRS